MVQSTNAAEQKSLDDAAREYEGRGYRVVKEPDTTQLPDFLAGFRPDLIAYGDRENIVIEVKSSAILPRSRDIVSLADVVNERPGWRFDLIVTNPATQEELTDLDWWEIRHRIADARELLSDQENAAALLAWSAAEAVMRLVAGQNKINLGNAQRNSPSFLAKKLFSLGLLSRADYDVLSESIPLRNLIIHGYRATGPTREEVHALIASVERLLAEASSQPMP